MDRWCSISTHDNIGTGGLQFPFVVASICTSSQWRRFPRLIPARCRRRYSETPAVRIRAALFRRSSPADARLHFEYVPYLPRRCTTAIAGTATAVAAAIAAAGVLSKGFYTGPVARGAPPSAHGHGSAHIISRSFGALKEVERIVFAHTRRTAPLLTGQYRKLLTRPWGPQCAY